VTIYDPVILTFWTCFVSHSFKYVRVRKIINIGLGLTKLLNVK